MCRSCCRRRPEWPAKHSNDPRSYPLRADAAHLRLLQRRDVNSDVDTGCDDVDGVIGERNIGLQQWIATSLVSAKSG